MAMSGMSRRTKACVLLVCATTTALVVDASSNARRSIVLSASSNTRRSIVVGAPLVAASQPAAAAYSVVKSDDEWRAQLGPEGYEILRRGATEAPNSSPLARETALGAYACAACGTALFSSAAKFESRTGWPCFGEPAPGAVQADGGGFLAGVTGVAFRCATCGGRVGERFGDGAAYPGTRAARTGLRWCANGAALVFVPADGSPPASGEPPAGLGKQQREVQDRGYRWQMRDGGLRPI